MTELVLPPAVLVATLAAEALHGRRCRRMAYLAFGPAGRPRSWVSGVAAVRALSAAALCWGLIVLLSIDPAAPVDAADRNAQGVAHLVLALDVSPSMLIGDSGPDGRSSRADRARELLRSLLERADLRSTRVSVVAFFTTGRAIVVDTFDPDVVANILNDLPLDHVFRRGRTNLYEGLKAAAEIGKDWRPDSATLVLVSDGDTLPASLPPLPPAFGKTLVVGVGDPYRGEFIDGHNSRQDAEALNRLALQLGGVYHDGNGRHVSTAVIQGLVASPPGSKPDRIGRREAALGAVGIGAALLALLSPALAWAGSNWRGPRNPAHDPLDDAGQLAAIHVRALGRADRRPAELPTANGVASW